MVDIYNKRISVQWLCSVAFFAVSLTIIIIFSRYNIGAEAAPLYFLGAVLLLVTSVPLMVNSKVKASTAASLMSISYGIFMALQNYQYMQSIQMSGVETVEITLYFIIYLIYLVMGIMIALFGLGLFLGYRYNSQRLTLVTYVCLAIIALPLLWQLHVGNFGSIWYLFEDCSDNYEAYNTFWYLFKSSLPTIIFFVLLLLCLSSPEIKFYSAANRISKNVSFISDEFSVANDSWIYRDDLKRLLDYENGKWYAVGGPVNGEMCFDIHVHKSTLRLMLLRMEDGTYRFKIAQNRSDMISDKINSQLTGIVLDGDVETCESFTVFGTDGVFIRLLVKDDKKAMKEKKKLRKVEDKTKEIVEDIVHDVDTGEEQ